MATCHTILEGISICHLHCHHGHHLSTDMKEVSHDQVKGELLPLLGLKIFLVPCQWDQIHFEPRLQYSLSLCVLAIWDKWPQDSRAWIDKELCIRAHKSMGMRYKQKPNWSSLLG